MSTFREWVNRLHFFRKRANFDSALCAEMQFHIEARAAELEETGVSKEEAIADASRDGICAKGTVKLISWISPVSASL